jgi:hypothetical protein
MEDKYGYVKLKSTLENIADKLNKEGYDDLANEVLRASKFYGGMPSEFMGESWLALRKVLACKNELSSETFELAESLCKEIKLGFERVGQKLPE